MGYGSGWIVRYFSCSFSGSSLSVASRGLLSTDALDLLQTASVRRNVGTIFMALHLTLSAQSTEGRGCTMHIAALATYYRLCFHWSINIHWPNEGKEMVAKEKRQRTSNGERGRWTMSFIFGTYLMSQFIFTYDHDALAVVDCEDRSLSHQLMVDNATSKHGGCVRGNDLPFEAYASILDCNVFCLRQIGRKRFRRKYA